MYRANVLVVVDEVELCNYVEDFEIEVHATMALRIKLAEFMSEIKTCNQGVMITAFISPIPEETEVEESFADKVKKLFR